MSTVPAAPDGKSDAELISAVRSGTIAAYGTLYERHVASAYNLARQMARSPAEADDLVAEAFAKVLDTLRAGKGPDSAFRAYLLTALRHTAYDKTRKDKRIDLNEDMSEVSGALGSALTVPFSDTAVAGLERTMAAKAFSRLPERWQAVLWHTEIEQQSPAEVAPLLGLTPNGVSALAYRAREGLRQAYLQVHLSETTGQRCRATADRLGAWTRDGLSKRERAQVETHLDECERCRALAAELADVNGAIRAVIGPLVLGGAVLGYLATAGAGKASAATAGAAAVGAAATGGAAASSGAGAGGAAAGAAAPRQFLGVAASGAAVATAIAIGLTAGGGQQIPLAIQPQANPPAAEQPAPAPPTAPAPAPEQAPPPAPPAAPPSESPEPPADEPVVAPEPEPPPAAVPLPAELFATPPSNGIELVPGGDAVDMPIKVRNDGQSKSDPVTVTLNLPSGVSAEDPAGGGGQPMSARTAPARSAQPSEDEAVPCPGGTGKVTCRTSDGLEPGESVTLLFRLVAAEGTEGGVITGTVSSGSSTTLRIRVPVRTPEPVDDVGLRVEHVGRILHIYVDNIGDTTERTTVTIDHPVLVHSGHRRVDCSDTSTTTTCRSKETVEPGETLRFHVILNRLPEAEAVTVTARLGTDSASKTVHPGCFAGSCATDVPSTPPSTSTTVTVPSQAATSTTSTTSERPLVPSTRPSVPSASKTKTMEPRHSKPDRGFGHWLVTKLFGR